MRLNPLVYGTGVVVTENFTYNDNYLVKYPVLLYPWADAKKVLETIAENSSVVEMVQVTYANSETGDDTKNHRF